MPLSTNAIRMVSWVILCLGALVLAACNGEATSTQAQQPMDVEVVLVEQKDVPIYSEWVGTTDGLVNAQIRAQVTGYLLRQRYREGAFVKKGDLLFEIDPRKFQAALDQAAGDLKKAQAQFTKTELDVKRNTPLAKEGAISQKELEDSIQANQATRASVESAKAALEQAKLNLGWTRITAPIDGVVGIAKTQIGDLVNSNDELTSMSQLDPIRVYFPISEQEYLRLAGRMQERYAEKVDPMKAREDARLEMTLSTGEIYPSKGWFFLADRQVDVKTGTIRIAALFPNPGNVLRPGQYAKVRAPLTVRQGALLVPQRTVSELQGSYQIAVVTPENKVEIRPVKVGERVDSRWIITEGLKAGEQVVAEGLQKVKAGATVKAKPFGAEPPASAAPQSESPQKGS
ncbi:MAG: efflux RND transporter periplasmic adaptor subunit [Nitrospiraceae bacterium]